MKLFVLHFVLTIIVSVFSYDSSKYSGYKVYQVTPKSLYEAYILKEFEHDEHFDFWTEIRSINLPVDIMVSPLAQNNFEAIMKSANIDYFVNIDDVEASLQNEENTSGRSIVTRGSVTFSDFMRHDDINAYLEQLAQDYPQIVSIESIGISFEGRDLLLVRISSGGSNKPTIYVQAAIHAREWIAPPVALYIINQLVENPDNVNLYEDVDWVVIPVVNPDGYEYTHTTERFWRKTRSTGTICYGIDGNRNFDALWGTVGASSWQCDITYRGHKAFSEVETQAVRDYILEHKDDIKLFLDVHSFGRWLLYPYGYSDDEPDDVEELRTLGRLFNDAIHSVRGLNYTVLSFASGLYYASGTSVDWAKDIGIELAYTIELPSGGTGFDPPSSDIEPVVEETWEGFKAFHSYIVDKFVTN
ncbi:carboxypeptidase B-like [Anoplophora glabripennis]|uniref:carboxypeptidase B-like n=1 Tax=Anoplophora glabripennis TaxID=217634 RepID=UPI0008737B3E|nr:carboxypeptidase B-like [Anoplophora glabripennis]